MTEHEISPQFPFTLQRIKVLDAEMAYVDTAPAETSPQQQPVMLFLHGNPASSYLWRNIIPHISSKTRCIAPDLVGMGASEKLPHLSYRFVEHALYLDEFIADVIPKNQKVILVVHDWGSALGLHWARRNEHRVAGLCFMEFVPPTLTWEFFGDAASTFQAFRGPAEVGRKLLIEDNFMIEKILPGGVVRGLTEKEMEHYRAPFLEPINREPLYRWLNEIPIEGQPPDVHAVVEKYHAWLLENDLPKLFFWASPGALTREEQAGWYQKTLKNMTSVHIGPGNHFLQEDNPHLIGKELAKWMDQVVIARDKGSKV